MKIFESILLTCTLFVSAHAYAAPLEFKDAYVPEAPPGAKAMAVYATIVNNSNRERSITSISSSEFGKVEMHESIIEDNVARMQKIDSLTIPPEGEVQLSPGGKHLMLLEPARRYMQGEMIVLYITEKDGTEHVLAIPVKKMEKTQHHHHEQTK